MTNKEKKIINSIEVTKHKELNMTKAELVAKIAEKTGLSKKDSEAALNAFMDAVKEALSNGEKVSLVGFGTFEVVERAERKGFKKVS